MTARRKVWLACLVGVAICLAVILPWQCPRARRDISNTSFPEFAFSWPQHYLSTEACTILETAVGLSDAPVDVADRRAPNEQVRSLLARHHFFLRYVDRIVESPADEGCFLWLAPLRNPQYYISRLLGASRLLGLKATVAMEDGNLQEAARCILAQRRIAECLAAVPDLLCISCSARISGEASESARALLFSGVREDRILQAICQKRRTKLEEALARFLMWRARDESTRNEWTSTLDRQMAAALAGPYRQVQQKLSSLSQEAAKMGTSARERVELVAAVHRSIADANVREELLRLGAAVLRYYMNHGVVPNNSEELFNDWHDGPLPVDVFSGAALHFAVCGNGDLLLYSVGHDGEDNGGTGVPWSHGSGPDIPLRIPLAVLNGKPLGDEPGPGFEGVDRDRSVPKGP